MEGTIEMVMTTMMMVLELEKVEFYVVHNTVEMARPERLKNAVQPAVRAGLHFLNVQGEPFLHSLRNR